MNGFTKCWDSAAADPPVGSSVAWETKDVFLSYL